MHQEDISSATETNHLQLRRHRAECNKLGDNMTIITLCGVGNCTFLCGDSTKRIHKPSFMQDRADVWTVYIEEFHIGGNFTLWSK